MTTQEQIQLALSEFGKQHGVDGGLTLDSENTCILSFNDELQTVIELREGDQLSISTSLGVPDEEGAGYVYRKCLEKHLFWEEISDRIFAVDPETGGIELISTMSAEGMSAERIEAAIEGQLVEATEWLPLVLAKGGTDDPVASESEQDPEAEHTVRV